MESGFWCVPHRRRAAVQKSLAGVSIASAATAGATWLAACGLPGGQPAAKEAGPQTISFATDWSSGTRAEIMKQSLAVFAEKHPLIKVERTDIGDNYYDAITGRFAAGTQEDLIIFDGPQFGAFRELGAFEDLTPMFKAAKIDPQKMYTVIDPVYSVNGKIYATPFQLTLGDWYVNKTLFAQEGVAPPTEAWTWNEWADAARKLTKPDKNQFGLGPVLNTNLQVSMLPLLLSNGGHHISADFKQTQLLVPPSLDVIRWVADRHQRDRSWVGHDAKNVSFGNGNVAMAWGNTGGIGSSAGGNVQGLAGKFDWDLMPMPKAPGTGKSVTTFNIQPYTLSAKKGSSAGRVDAAFTFMLHLAGRDTQVLVAKIRGATPVLKELVGTTPYTDTPPASMNLVVKSAETAQHMRFFSGYLEWRDAYAGQLMDIWANKISADAGAQKANDAGNAVLARLAKK